MSNRGEPKKEDVFTVILVILGCTAAIVFLIWLVGASRIVTFWSPKMYALGRIWMWLPGDLGIEKTRELYDTANAFVANPRGVSFFEWVGFVNKSMLPVALFVVTLTSGLVAFLMLKPTPQVRRTFTPQALAEHLSHVFTGVAPVLHLRKAIAGDKEPYWRRQVFPHELVMNAKVDGKPILVEGKVDEGRLTSYLRGIEMVRTQQGLVPKSMGGRLVSRTLGHQVVSLMSDRGKKGTCFPDRFSSAGKVIFALLCAHAFGGEEGKKDYAKARDQLNNSARGASHGFANLTVAQWLYDKYRTNAAATKLFAVHHWEYTYLYALAIAAKRQGKCGHWEFLWLKPMCRTLFYVMNNVGRLTPHAESAAAFGQYIFERRVAQRRRLPLQRGPNGGYVHVIYVDKAVKGFCTDWARWVEGAEEDDEWWLSEDPWNVLNGIRIDPPPAPPRELAQETAFDMRMSRQAHDPDVPGPAPGATANGRAEGGGPGGAEAGLPVW